MNPKTHREATTSGGARRRQGLTPRTVAVLVLAALVLVFVFENTQRTRIRLFVPLVTMPLWLALLGTGVIGALCGALLVSRRR
ncbi:LapA family protein [Streptomyces sp. NPDC001796]|uniref:LapA family protein n=1 Tax=Streptomyces sp. NPDC001796 TaxID=3364609 RepID=UPI0036B3AF62